MVSLLQWKKKQKNILWFALCVGVAWVAVVCHTWGMWSSTSFCHTLSYFPKPSCKASNHNAYIRKDNAFAIESHWSWYISKYRISFVRTVHVQYLKELKMRIVFTFYFWPDYFFKTWKTTYFWSNVLANKSMVNMYNKLQNIEEGSSVEFQLNHCTLRNLMINEPCFWPC